MTQDEIIRMALEADCYKTETGALITDNVNLERFAALVAAHEREACAKVCDEYADDVETYHWDEGQAQFGRSCSAAIRARGEK